MFKIIKTNIKQIKQINNLKFIIKNCNNQKINFKSKINLKINNLTLKIQIYHLIQDKKFYIILNI